MKCWSCGREVSGTGPVFCPHCGARLQGAGAGQADASAPATGEKPHIPEVPDSEVQRYVTPFPSEMLGPGSVPGSTYDSLGTDYETPETVTSSEEIGSGQTGEGYGRPASRTPGVVVVTLVVVLAACAGVAGVYYALNGRPIGLSDIQSVVAGGSASSSLTSSSQAEDAQETDGSSVVLTDAQRQYLVGTWQGTYQGSDDGGGVCHGSQLKPSVLDIKSVDENGRIVADIRTCYHAHGRAEGTISSSTNDVYLEADNATMTMDGIGGFSVTFDLGNIDSSFDNPGYSCKMSFYLEGDSDTPELKGDVKSGYDFEYQDDTFTFAKS